MSTNLPLITVGASRDVSPSLTVARPVVIDNIHPSGTHTWQAEYLARLGDMLYPTSPGLARLLWAETTATAFTGALILGLMVAIERKL